MLKYLTTWLEFNIDYVSSTSILGTYKSDKCFVLPVTSLKFLEVSLCFYLKTNITNLIVICVTTKT